MDENPYPAQNGIQQSGMHTTIQQIRECTVVQMAVKEISICLETLSNGKQSSKSLINIKQNSSNIA